MCRERCVVAWLCLPQSAAITCAGPQLDVPHDVSCAHLEALLDGVQRSSEQKKHSFFIQGHELTGELGAHLQQHKVPTMLWLDSSSAQTAGLGLQLTHGG